MNPSKLRQSTGLTGESTDLALLAFLGVISPMVGLTLKSGHSSFFVVCIGLGSTRGSVEQIQCLTTSIRAGVVVGARVLWQVPPA